MKIEGCIALVTGANRGLGAAFARALRAGGAAKVYAAARNPSSVKHSGVLPVELVVTQPEQIAALAHDLRDVTLSVNNAGVFEPGPLLAQNETEALHAGQREVLVDDITRQVRGGFDAAPAVCLGAGA